MSTNGTNSWIIEAPRRATPARGIGLRHIMYAIVWIALGLWAVVQLKWALLVLLFLIVPPALVVGGFMLVAGWTATQQDALLRVMAIAAERQMPLAPGIEAFAGLCGGWYRRKVTALAYLLDAGVPLPQALASIPGILPRPAIVLACVGWNDGALASALRDAVAAGEARRAYRAAFVPKLAYLAASLFVLQTIVAFMLYFIVPKFEAIFFDFGTPLPAPTVFLIQGSHWFLRSGILLLLVPMELAVLLYVPFSYFGWIQWDVPFVDYFLRRRDTAAVLRALAIGIDGGKPLASSVGLLAGFYPRAWVRRRLYRVYERMQQGMAWVEALYRHGLIRRADAAVLDSAQRAGNLAWAMRVMADGNDRSLGYRLQALSQVLFPVVVVALGVVVAVVAIGFFYPLIRLIERFAV